MGIVCCSSSGLAAEVWADSGLWDPEVPGQWSPLRGFQGSSGECPSQTLPRCGPSTGAGGTKSPVDPQSGCCHRTEPVLSGRPLYKSPPRIPTDGSSSTQQALWMGVCEEPKVGPEMLGFDELSGVSLPWPAGATASRPEWRFGVSSTGTSVGWLKADVPSVACACASGLYRTMLALCPVPTRDNHREISHY